ncbi:MAG: hypothetical protein GX448_10115 [Planctomycetes bacterium]|jgi:hypothetical protein|nr:hypothetical protein [Planctomycetota bacterium]
MTTDRDRSHDAGREIEELAGRLCRLLEEQLIAGREGDLSRVEQLGWQADALVTGITCREGGAAGISQTRRRDLKRSYDELTLMLKAEQADVQGKLKQLRKVKRVVGAYRTNR